MTPKYNNEIVEAKVGEKFHGVSRINEKGRRKITDHKVVDVVTFSFFLFFDKVIINKDNAVKSRT